MQNAPAGFPEVSAGLSDDTGTVPLNRNSATFRGAVICVRRGLSDIFGGAVPLYWVRLVNGIDRPKRIYSANDPDHALLQWSGYPSLEEASQRLGLTVGEYRAMFIVEETAARSS